MIRSTCDTGVRPIDLINQSPDILFNTTVPSHNPPKVPNALPRVPTNIPGTILLFQPLAVAKEEAVAALPIFALL
jgi:hypothetical protein